MDLEKIRSEYVVKSNDLIRESRFSLSTVEQKIVLYIVSKISMHDTVLPELEFEIKDFCMVCGLDEKNGWHYQNMKDAIKNLRDRSIYITLPDGSETTVSWIEKPYLHKGSGKVRIRLDQDMAPYLLHLKRDFTKYQLFNILRMRSQYSIRLYELVCSVHYSPFDAYTAVYPVDELKKLMGAEHYKTYQHFKDRALLRAVGEINAYTDKEVVMETIKEGRAVDKISLTIRTKQIEQRMHIFCEAMEVLGDA